MIASIWLEHYTIKNARRALLISAFSTILLPSVNIIGDGLEILGLTILIERSSILTTTRILTIYFLWVFCWLNISNCAIFIKNIIENIYNRKVEIRKSEADEIDRDPRGQGIPEQEIEPWMAHFHKEKDKLDHRKDIFSSIPKIFGLLAVLCVEYAPPIVLAALAILAPEATNEAIFSYLK